MTLLTEGRSRRRRPGAWWWWPVSGIIGAGGAILLTSLTGAGWEAAFVWGLVVGVTTGFLHLRR